MQVLLQILLYQGLFLLAYQLIKKSHFFQLNRFYLLGSIVASIAIPFLELNWFQISIGQENLKHLPTVYLPEVFVGNSNTEAELLFKPKKVVDYGSIFENLYWVGFAIAFSMLYMKVNYMINLIQAHLTSNENHFKIVHLHETKEAFSFYHFIFLGKELNKEERKAILLHEQQHVHLNHSIDNSLLAILRVLMWFNPLLYLYQKELQLVHEYQADAKVCQQLNPKQYVYQLLHTAFQTQNLGLMSSFYYKSFIKNRITMLQKKESKKMALLRYAIITPILVLLVGFNAIAQEALPKDEQALLEKYKKEIEVLKEANDFSVYDKYILKLPKNDGVLTKDSYYKMMAFAALSHESMHDDLIEESNNFLNKSYSTYVKEQKERIESGNYVPFRSIEEYEQGDVPFSSVDQVPIFPGCEEGKTNSELRTCMVEKVSNYVNENFDTSIGKKLGLTGINRVYVRFMITKNGEISDVQARSYHPDLSKAGEEVIKSLPQMKPGMHQGEAVNVLYTLPITFNIPEKESKVDE